MKRYMYTFPHGNVKDHGMVNINDDGYIDDESHPGNGTPIEDYGNYLLSDDPLDDPFQDFLDLLKIDYVWTRSDVENLKVGDRVINCFGELATVVEIYGRGVDENGKAYACFYQKFGEGRMSNSVKEGKVICTVK